MVWGDTRRDLGTRAHKARRRRILARDGYQCQIRGPRCTGKATVLDHILAVGLGGDADSDDNTQAACANCNQQKAAHEGVQARATRRRRPPPNHPATI